MDRRYREHRFYNGARASSRSADQGEALVRRYLAQARKSSAGAQSYGGSTGGVSSAGGGGAVLLERNQDVKDAREIFKQEGSGSLGGRASLAEARGFRTPRAAAAVAAAG